MDMSRDPKCWSELPSLLGPGPDPGALCTISIVAIRAVVRTGVRSNPFTFHFHPAKELSSILPPAPGPDARTQDKADVVQYTRGIDFPDKKGSWSEARLHRS